MSPRRSTTRGALPLSLPPRTLFVTGKGGVGKSTVAAALALAFRDAGVRTLLVELEGQRSSASLLGTRVPKYEPTSLSPGLWALRIDAENALREYARIRLKVKLLADRLVGNQIFLQFAQAAPGFRELLVLGKLWALSREQTTRGKPRFEAIIVDAPATGHGLGLLGMAGVVARMFPVGPISSEARAVDGFVKDHSRVGVVLVSLPEEMPVNETIDLHARLEQQGVDVAAIVLNGMLEQRFDDDAAEAVAAARAKLPDEADPSVIAALETALYEHDRAEEQQSERARLEQALGPAQVLPFVYAAELGSPEVHELARVLAPERPAPAATSTRATSRAGAGR